jgi:phage/conjugal plasmid C-4 type zinc finger TraR family protein
MTMYSYSQNRHTDPADISSNLEQRLNDLRVKAASAQAANGLKGIGTSECVDCDTAIDTKRKELLPAATRCAPCQQDREQLGSLSGYGRD